MAVFFVAVFFKIRAVIGKAVMVVAMTIETIAVAVMTPVPTPVPTLVLMPHGGGVDYLRRCLINHGRLIERID